MRAVRKAYHLPVPLSWNLGTLTSWNPLGHSRPVTGQIYLTFFYLFVIIIIVVTVFAAVAAAVVAAAVVVAAVAVHFPYFTAVQLVLTTARVSLTKHYLFTALPEHFGLRGMYWILLPSALEYIEQSGD